MPLKSAVGEMEIKKREFCFLFFGRQCTGSAGGFDKHTIKKPWPYGESKNKHFCTIEIIHYKLTKVSNRLAQMNHMKCIDQLVET